jgi:hypothetical protein
MRFDHRIVRLLAAITAAEDSARRQDEHLSGHERPYNLDDPTDPAVVLRHCTADREIVEEFMRTEPSTLMWCGLRFAVQKIAEGYDLTTWEVPDGHHDH